MSDEEITRYPCAVCAEPVETLDPWEYLVNGKPTHRACWDKFAASAQAGPAGPMVPQPPIKVPF